MSIGCFWFPSVHSNCCCELKEKITDRAMWASDCVCVRFGDSHAHTWVHSLYFGFIETLGVDMMVLSGRTFSAFWFLDCNIRSGWLPFLFSRLHFLLWVIMFSSCTLHLPYVYKSVLFSVLALVHFHFSSTRNGLTQDHYHLLLPKPNYLAWTSVFWANNSYLWTFYKETWSYHNQDCDIIFLSK